MRACAGDTQSLRVQSLRVDANRFCDVAAQYHLSCLRLTVCRDWGWGGR
jgi:hypothetical protein